MLMIKRKVRALSTGQMAGSTKAAGKMENNMEMEIIHLPVEKLNKEDGKKERDSSG